MVIDDLHTRTTLSGVYTDFSELRKFFLVPHCFSIVKKVLRRCISCRLFDNHTQKLTQSPYRDFPPNFPYRSFCIDYLGPYYVRYDGSKAKVWLLTVTCLWLRAINLKVHLDQELFRCTCLSMASHSITFQTMVLKLCLALT